MVVRAFIDIDVISDSDAVAKNSRGRVSETVLNFCELVVPGGSVGLSIGRSAASGISFWRLVT